MDYKIGDKVVYPNHGVGIIEQINFGVLNGRTEKYYMLKIYSSGLKVMVPATNAISVGLRPVIRNGETLKVLSFSGKGQTQFAPRLEAPIQREFRTHADRRAHRSGRGT